MPVQAIQLAADCRVHGQQTGVRLDLRPNALYPRAMQTALNTLIPVFALATFAVLCVGIFALFRGGRFNRSYSNLLMRWRILLQFIAIVLVAVASFVFGK